MDEIYHETKIFEKAGRFVEQFNRTLPRFRCIFCRLSDRFRFSENSCIALVAACSSLHDVCVKVCIGQVCFF